MSTPSKPLADLKQSDHTPGGGATPEAFNRSKRRQLEIKSDWDGWLNEMLNQVEEEERFLDEIKYREGIRNQKYYEGEFFWRFSDETGEVRDLPHTDTDPFF